MTKVGGEEAKAYDAVRLDSYTSVNSGELVAADTITGRVVWRDSTGTEKSLVLGEHMIALVRKGR